MFILILIYLLDETVKNEKTIALIAHEKENSKKEQAKQKIISEKTERKKHKEHKAKEKLSKYGVLKEKTTQLKHSDDEHNRQTVLNKVYKM